MRIANISYSYGGIKTLCDVSLDIKPNCITGLIGPNGSGKSTFVNLATGMLIKGNKNLAIARTFQDSRIWNNLSILDNVLLTCLTRNVISSMINFKNNSKRAVQALEIVGLLHRKNELANILSYGQRKLLELARVIAWNRDVIFLDEIFAGLFPETREEIKAILIRLKQSGKSILVIEHDMETIKELCDFTYVLDCGVVIAEGETKNVLNNIKVKRAYLGI